jgi:hypothetical protein
MDCSPRKIESELTAWNWIALKQQDEVGFQAGHEESVKMRSISLGSRICNER